LKSKGRLDRYIIESLSIYVFREIVKQSEARSYIHQIMATVYKKIDCELLEKVRLQEIADNNPEFFSNQNYCVLKA
jgi:hypothetical protein